MAVMRRALLMLIVLVAVTVSAAPSIQAHANKKPGVTPAGFIECQYTTETDNVSIPDTYNPYTDGTNADPSRNNQWEVYYDIKRDTYDGAPCQMRGVVRIFPPNNGSFSGNLDVSATSNGYFITGSRGVLNGGYTAYPSHLVFRGPWFGVTSGSYTIWSYYQQPSGSWFNEADANFTLS